jgi:hypothetical protein
MLTFVIASVVASIQRESCELTADYDLETLLSKRFPYCHIKNTALFMIPQAADKLV